MTASKIFLYFCLSFIFGIFLNSIFSIPQLILLAFLIFGILSISLFWLHKKLVVIGFCILFLILGIFRHQAALLKIENSPIKNFFGKEITLIGLVDGEPERREKIQKIKIRLEEIKSNESIYRSIEERILVTTWKYPEYQYGDKLEIRGKLEIPPEFEGFNYKDYLLKDGILALIYFPKIELISKNQGNFLKRSLISFKNKLEDSLNKATARPQSAILEAFLFGEEEKIPKDLKEKLNLTGTRHITAVSGMNITIITFLLLNFLLSLGFYRSQAFYLSIILIIFYVLMIGAPASAIRAAIMAILLLTAQHFGRLSSASRTILFAAASMLALNPLLLKSDVGFQLSFLATMGLIFFQPILLDFFKKIPNAFQLRYNLSATLAAQIFVFPILIYNFGKISIVSPMTNVLILPLIPLITIFGFFFSFIGIFWQTLGQILSWPAWLLITYILKIVDFSSKIPFAYLSIQKFSLFLLSLSYSILAILVWKFKEREKLKFLGIL